MAAPPKPWKAEYAKSGRSSCKTCKSPIDKEALRLGKMVQSSQFDGFIPMWNHASCILKKAKQVKSIDDVEGLESLRWDDQQKIRKYVEGGGSLSKEESGPAPARASTPSESTVEVSSTSRASCKHCGEKITKGEVRISSKPDRPGAKGLAWHHANCFLNKVPSTQLDGLMGWNSLSPSDQAAISALVKEDSHPAEGDSTEDQDEEVLSTSRAGVKRKKDVINNQKSKLVRCEGNGAGKTTVEDGKMLQREAEMEAQSKELWALKDDLKKHVSTAEMREMLEANGQESAGSELDLRDRCADGMLFGALASCPLCSGFLHYSGGLYKCHGYLSAWSKCSYSHREPERLKGKWKIPDGTKNKFLTQWNKSQKSKKPIRILPETSTNSSCGSEVAVASKSETLEDLKVAVVGPTKESVNEWRAKLEEAGTLVYAKIIKGISCVVVGGELDGTETELKKARRMKIPVVREDYLVDCLNRRKKLPFDLYRVENMEKASSLVTVKVKGRSAVHVASGLQDSGHILEEGKSIYNTTLNMSDLSTGVNSYYILQIIQEDKGSDCYVFRKWGRVGNERIGGNKLEELSKGDAIHEFKRLFFEKTGNSWEAWESKEGFHKQPGRFYPLDIDYGVNKQVTKKASSDEESQLAGPLVELMKMLFNVETYRAAMMEFEINMSEMPLGKLSKSNIQKGFEALTDIQNLLQDDTREPHVKETLLVDASNRFFTMIPSIHPHIIRDEIDFQSKVKMLDALQEIEIASRLVGFDIESDDSIDDKYKKLRCDIDPLPHDSQEFELVEKYLRNTHAPTHTDWRLELEEVFSLEREGESDKYAPHRQSIGNRMLLWHGSRLTNFVGILSQGLRIAPPEAPATGYMFGKGVYFADMVSKSAQYCFTDKKNPVGLMLLSEVALGEMYELKNAKYMDKPPKGKHSTKGLGKTIPRESEYVKWKDDMIVPCGKPVSSKVKASELMYNEYIVYDTSQVKMQYLLKVRFHHKR
ncbi:hypothetical protein MLD38_020224 [Melastoma candidum]|uniref:Uncharacterized protein n=1 Tax=Melastoma candidum TaxID=119954 RepID=A0ACB9QF91_9MYRT|nr:hypothetical protein MLD38_020224 [Melastoma candidum]